MVVHISYDLCKSHKDYESLYKAIKNLGSWCHAVDSTWYVDTALSASVARDQLKAVMDSDDKLIVTKAVAPGAWHNLGDDITKWLKKHLV